MIVLTLASKALNSREKKHLFDCASPDKTARQPVGALEPHRVFFHLSVDGVRQMNDEHFPLEIDFRYFWPSKVLNSFSHGERADAREANAYVKLSVPDVLNRVWIYPISFKAPSDYDKLVVHGDNILGRLTFSVQLDDFLFKF